MIRDPNHRSGEMHHGIRKILLGTTVAGSSHTNTHKMVQMYVNE